MDDSPYISTSLVAIFLETEEIHESFPVSSKNFCPLRTKRKYSMTSAHEAKRHQMVHQLHTPNMGQPALSSHDLKTFRSWPQIVYNTHITHRSIVWNPCVKEAINFQTKSWNVNSSECSSRKKTYLRFVWRGGKFLYTRNIFKAMRRKKHENFSIRYSN